MVRIYWNKKEAVDGLVWSVDQGDISTEVNVKAVICYVSLVTDENLNASEGEPKGWMQSPSGTIYIDKADQTAYIKKEAE